MSSNKIKSKGKIAKPCTNCFSPMYFKFNLAYLKNWNKLEDKYRAQLFNRMCELSAEPFILVMNRRRNIGFEIEHLDVGHQIPTVFAERFNKDLYSKFAVIRLYPNNNPVMARVVGVLINKIFYIFYVDFGETGYKR